MGRLNEDEGWYLEAARRVYAGQLPYRDFAFTQTPLAPYVYGLPLRLFGGGLWTGRATALLLGLGALLFAMAAARRLAGERAAIAAGLLLATNAYAVAYLGLVKTYAPAACLLAAAAWAYASPPGATWRAPLALGLAAGATLARLSLLPAVAILGLALLAEARGRRDRAAAAGGLALAAALLALPALPDPAAFRFGAIDYPLANQARYHLTRADLAGGWQAYLAVKLPLAGAILAGWGAAGPALVAGAAGWLRRPRGGRAATLAAALVAVLAAQLAGAPYAEYAAPLAPLVALLGGVALAAGIARLPRGPTRGWRGPLVAAIAVAGLATADAGRLHPGVPVPLAQLDAAAAQVRDRVPPGEEFWTFDTYLAVAAGRPVPTWLALSHYSYYGSLPDGGAARYRVANDAGLRRALAGPPPAALAVTDTTFAIFAPPAPGEPSIRELIGARYRVVATVPNFGQWGDTLYIYVPRGR
jgi:4-amino-4-deoxy-L-arabinose transferase-like glycosyltransferase